ncbi:MAG: T9SS type A sorting domain-containing protein [Chitinophagales bacterium]|nr:T9SS type A sorting domain-containing protein [Chitinophagales bacterium]
MKTIITKPCYFILLLGILLGITEKTQAQSSAPYIVATVQPVEKSNSNSVGCACAGTANYVSVTISTSTQTTTQYYERVDFCTKKVPTVVPPPLNPIILPPCNTGAKYDEDEKMQIPFVVALTGENLNLSYVLSQDDWVTIQLYSVTGQLMADILPPTYQKEGNYSTALDVETLSKGLYLCVLKRGTERITQKVLKDY